MSEPKEIPRIVISLGSNPSRARDFIKQTDLFDGAMGVQLAPMPDIHDLTLMTKERGIHTTVNTHFTNEADIQADYLSNYLFRNGKLREYAPDAVSLEPQYLAPEVENTKLKDAVEHAQEHGVTVIGVPNSYSLPIGHTTEFVRTATNACRHLGSLGITSAEIIYPILDDLINAEGIDAKSLHLIVSKTSRRKPVLPYDIEAPAQAKPTQSRVIRTEIDLVREGAINSLEMGARSIVLGRTYMKIPDFNLQQQAIQEIIDMTRASSL